MSQPIRVHAYFGTRGYERETFDCPIRASEYIWRCWAHGAQHVKAEYVGSGAEFTPSTAKDGE